MKFSESESLRREFKASFSQMIASGEGWESWFDSSDSNEPEVLPPDPMPKQVAERMLLEGVTYWTHPGWAREVACVFWDWFKQNKLVTAQLIAKQLLPAIPKEYETEECAECIAIALGDLGAPVDPLECLWPAPAQFYASRLDLRMAEFACDRQLQKSAEFWAQRKAESLMAGEA